MRLQKFMATAGVASRRASETIVAAGRVTINGETVTDPARDVGDGDDVRVDGRRIGPDNAGTRVVYAVHKPAGVVSTARDPQGRATVVSLVRVASRLYPVGRLDADTTGLILLTNDGDLAHRLTHPRFEVPKTYRARLNGPPITDAKIRVLRSGVRLEDGPTAPARVRRIGAPADNVIELTIHEGRNRQVRRMCEAVGHRVRTLTRISFGGLELGDLPSGGSRRLSPEEVARLSAGTEARRGAGASRSARGRAPGG
ncbi:MAG TPA: pseudouridine synthase [Solirubrobacteraceae bacterium]|nr:pseudouridine synthase [Solirubrobacteraceae bacterium]